MCDDVTARPGYVLFKLERGREAREGGRRWGELEECQTLDWISMNSKEVTGGKARKRRGDEEEEVIWTASCNPPPPAAGLRGASRFQYDPVRPGAAGSR